MNTERTESSPSSPSPQPEALIARFSSEVAPIDRERFCQQPFEQAHHYAQSACIRCGLPERIHLRLEVLAALSAPPSAALGAEVPAEPRVIAESFLRGVVSATTSYSEGWRDVCARLLWAEATIAALRASASAPEHVVEAVYREIVTPGDGSMRDAIRAGLESASSPTTEDHLDIYVPGVTRCLKCGFELTRATLFAQTGEVGLTRAEALVEHAGEPCPNDGEPMIKVRWSERAQQNYEAYGALMNEIIGAAGMDITTGNLPAALAKVRQMASSPAAPALKDEIGNALLRLRGLLLMWAEWIEDNAEGGAQHSSANAVVQDMRHRSDELAALVAQEAEKPRTTCPNCGGSNVVTWPAWPGLYGCTESNCLWRWRPPSNEASSEYMPPMQARSWEAEQETPEPSVLSAPPSRGRGGAPGVCFDIDGNWWHEPGSCKFCRDAPSRGRESVLRRDGQSPVHVGLDQDQQQRPDRDAIVRRDGREPLPDAGIDVGEGEVRHPQSRPQVASRGREEQEPKIASRDDVKDVYAEGLRVGMALGRQLGPEPAIDDGDEPHTGDDDLLDYISAACTALDEAIDEQDIEFGEGIRDVIAGVMDDLTKAQEHRVQQLKTAAHPSRGLGSDPRAAEVIEEAEKLLKGIGSEDWHPDHDWRDDGADQVLNGRDKTVCFLATGMSHDLHYSRCEFIAAAPRLVRRLLALLAAEGSGSPRGQEGG